MQNGYVTDTVTTVDVLDFIKIGGKVNEIYEGVLCRGNFKKSPFTEFLVELFALRQKFRDENNNVMQFLVKISMNSLYGENTRKVVDESFACNSEYWMMSEYDERVKDYWRISHGNFFNKLVDDKGLEDEVKKLITMPLHLKAFVISNSKRIMHNFIHANNGFNTNDVYYGDTDSSYLEKKTLGKLD